MDAVKNIFCMGEEKMRVQSVQEQNSKIISLLKIKITGISLPIYILMTLLISIAAFTEVLPKNMVGALAVLIILGGIFSVLGNNLPIIKTYLGGGAVFCIFASSALATFNILPESVVKNCDDFMNGMGFIDLYIAALITGSILGMILGYGFSESILYIALPMMSGGMGAGVIPLSGIYAGSLGTDAANIISRMIPASTLGNVFAIICAAIVAKIGTVKTNWNGNGTLMEMKDEKKENKDKLKLDLVKMGTGLLMSLSFFTLGKIVNKFVPGIHAYAFMIIMVVVCKCIGIIPKHYEESSVMWSQFVMKNLTNALLAGIGLTLLDLKELASAISPAYVLICLMTIITVAICAGIGGKIVGFYPIESSITAGLCTNSMGGTGNIAVLSAANRMELIPFAQMATRLGGAMILIISNLLIQILT